MVQLAPLDPDRACSYCKVTAPGGYCSDCHVYLCATCQPSHQGHQLESRDLIEQRGLPQLSRSCHVHPGQILMVRGETGELSCPECDLGGGSFRSVLGLAGESRAGLKKLDKQMEMKSKQIVKETLERNLRELRAERARAMEEVEKKYDLLEREALKAKIQDPAVKNLQETARFMFTQGNDIEVMRASKDLAEKMSGWLEGANL